MNIDTYPSNSLRYYNTTNGVDYAYNNSLSSPISFTHTTAVYRWKFTLNEYADGFVRFYINGTYKERFPTKLTAGTIGVMRYEEENTDGEDLCAGPPQCYASAGGVFDNITVTPNDNYRNILSTITLFTPITDPVPVISIILPANATYTTANRSLVTNWSDSNPSTFWYILDAGSNITFNQNTTFIASDGSHTISVYLNDTSGGIGSGSVSFSVNTTVPATPPGNGTTIIVGTTDPNVFLWLVIFFLVIVGLFYLVR
jgi:hypothetical protein